MDKCLFSGADLSFGGGKFNHDRSRMIGEVRKKVRGQDEMLIV